MGADLVAAVRELCHESEELARAQAAQAGWKLTEMRAYRLARKVAGLLDSMKVQAGGENDVPQDR